MSANTLKIGNIKYGATNTATVKDSFKKRLNNLLHKADLFSNFFSLYEDLEKVLNIHCFVYFCINNNDFKCNCIGILKTRIAGTLYFYAIGANGNFNLFSICIEVLGIFFFKKYSAKCI